MFRIKLGFTWGTDVGEPMQKGVTPLAFPFRRLAYAENVKPGAYICWLAWERASGPWNFVPKPLVLRGNRITKVYPENGLYDKAQFWIEFGLKLQFRTEF